MRNIFILLILIAPAMPSAAQGQKKITILHTNDLHSRLTGYSPESSYSPLSVNDDDTEGGFARIATIIRNEKKSSTGPMLVLDAGDFLMGTIFQSLEVNTGFQLRMMRLMGYDAVCLGNHEFDYGPEMLAGIVSSAAKGGPSPSILSGNITFSVKEKGDDALEKLYDEGILKRKLIIERNGLKIGLFSLMGKVADENAAFADPVTFSKQVPFARKMVKELKNDKCDLIICLSHSGVSKNKDGSWAGEDIELAKKVKGISVIISGHTHTKLDKPLIVEGVPVVQTGEYGHYVGKLVLALNNGKVRVDDYSLIAVNDSIHGDPQIQRLVEGQKKLIDTRILSQIGMSYGKPVAESRFLLECNEYGDFKGSNLGPMVADAIRLYVNSHNSKGADISMVAVGVIRDKIVPGIQTAPDIFRVMSMGKGISDIPGYPLSRLYFTGKELKSILEIMQIAYKKAPEYYCYYSGIKVDFNPEKGLFKKIIRVEVEHPDGTHSDVDFSKKNGTLYSITANSYMLEFIGIIRKMSFGLINIVPKDSEGNKIEDMKTAIIDMDENSEGTQEGREWLALMELIASMKDTNGNGVPDIDEKYSVPVQSFTDIR